MSGRIPFKTGDVRTDKNFKELLTRLGNYFNKTEITSLIAGFLNNNFKLSGGNYEPQEVNTLWEAIKGSFVINGGTYEGTPRFKITGGDY